MHSNNVEVVISGIGGKFPEANNVEEFKEKLLSKSKLLVRDDTRWNPGGEETPIFSGRIPDWNKFDGNFFGMHPKLVRNSDPMQGLLLEKSYEAMVDADMLLTFTFLCLALYEEKPSYMEAKLWNNLPDDIKICNGKNFKQRVKQWLLKTPFYTFDEYFTSVSPFMTTKKNICVLSATSLSDAELLQTIDSLFLEGLALVGHNRSMMANRISYYFNLSGPSYNYESSWSSGMEMLSRASTLLAQGSVDGALVVGCRLLGYNSVDLQYRNLNLLAPDVECLPFDADASGFVRSESVGAFFLQRSPDAKRKYCSIVHIDQLYIGDKSSGFLSCPRIEQFLTNFYQNCGVSPSEVSYLEAGSYCNKNADVSELNGVANAFGLKQTTKPLLIGSVMGNIGNTECTSSLVSLTKVIIALETGIIPPTVNYNTPNPDVPALVSGKLKPVTEPTDLPGDLVAVTSIGLFGSASHVLVKGHNKTKQTLSPGVLPADGLPRLMILQARHEEGARAIVNKVQSMPVDVEFISLANDVFQTPFRSYLWRAYAVLPSTPNNVETIQIFEPTNRPIWFVFSGMGSQWVGMGKELLKLPVFSAAIDKCDTVLRPRGVDLKHILTTDDDTVFYNILNCFVGISAVQIGLVDTLKALGVTPDGMIGHSAGELGCSYADGCLTAEETILAAYSRGKASLDADFNEIGGMMAAVGMGYSDIKDRIPESLDVACHNAVDSCTVSGPEEDVLQYVAQLKQQGVFAKAVSAGGIAYHSRYIRSAAPMLLKYLKEVIPNPKPRSARWVSSSVPQVNWDSEDAKLCSPEYHTNNLLNPVLFEEACSHLPKNTIAVEIAPHGLLQAILRRSISNECTNIPLTSRGAESNLNYLLNAVGKLHLNNVSVDVNALFPAVQYPVAKGTPSLVDLVTWSHEDECYKKYSARLHKLFSRGSREKIVKFDNNYPDYHTWKDFNIDGQVIVPLTQLLILPWKMILSQKRLQFEDTCVTIEDVTISDLLRVDESETDTLVTMGPASQTFEVSKTTLNHIDANIIVKGKLNIISPTTLTTPEYQEDESSLITGDEVYSVLSKFGWHYRHQSITQIVMTEKGCVARVKWAGDVLTFLEQLIAVLLYFQTHSTQSRCQLLYFKQLTVNVPVLIAAIKDSELEAFYNRACNTLLCQGVQLFGPVFGPITRPTHLDLTWNETKYQPYCQNKQSLSDFWASCLNIVSDAVLCSWSDTPVSPQLLIVKPDNEDLSDINEVINEAVKGNYVQLLQLKEVNISQAKKLVEETVPYGYIAACNQSVLRTMMNWEFEADNVFFLTYESNRMAKAELETLKSIQSYESIDRKLHLLKKVTDLTNSKPNILELVEHNWLSNLRQLMSKNGAHRTTVVVSCSLKPKEVLPILAKEPYVQNIRTVFILDSNLPPFKLSNPFYHDQLSNGLFVNILYGGLWNCLSNIRLDIAPKVTSLNSSVRSSENGMDVNVVGLNPDSFSPYPYEKREEPKVEHVDYVGYCKGTRVMGMAQFDSSSNSVIPDPILRWSVPEDWTMENAATVPVIFAMAYYCMHLKADLGKVKTILIHAGMSLLGQALVKIALGLHRDVFVSVLNDEEFKNIVSLFPFLNPKNIIILDKDDIQINIKNNTNGKGVDLVFNCLRGRHLQSTLGIMGFYCQMIDLAGVKIENRETLGMSVFIKSTSIKPVNLITLAQSSDSSKQSLQSILAKGINDGIVKPIKGKVFTLNELTSALRNLKDNHSTEKTLLFVESEGERVSKDIESVALIAGTRTDLWLDVVEWLARRGCRRLLLLADELQLFGSLERQLNQLAKHYDLESVIASAARLDTCESTRELLDHTRAMGSLSTIVCIGMDETSSRMKNLDAVSREAGLPVRQFVSLLGEGAAVSESRAQAGLPVCHVQSGSDLQQPALVVPYLSDILDHADLTARFLTVTERDISSSSAASSKVDFQNFLPSINDLFRPSGYNTDQPGFTEVTTLSPGYSFVKRDLLPVFVVPGLDVTGIQPLLQRIIHPAFCCKLPLCTDNFDQILESLIKEVLRVQGQGPYNIVGDSWGGSMAMALGCQLEARGYQVELILIEGAPPTIQDRVQVLCDYYDSDVGSSILAKVLNLTTKVAKDIARLNKWEEKLSAGLEQVSKNGRHSVSKALTSLHNHLTTAQMSRLPTKLFKGGVTLITCRQPSTADVAKLTQICCSNPEIMTVETKNYNDLISNNKTARVVNEKLLFSWK